MSELYDRLRAIRLNKADIGTKVNEDYNYLLDGVSKGRFRLFSSADSNHVVVPCIEVMTKGNAPMEKFIGIRKIFADTGKIGAQYGIAYFYDRYTNCGTPQKFKTSKGYFLVDTLVDTLEDKF